MIKLNLDKEIAYITLNRPQALNAVNQQMLTELNEAIDTIEKDKEIKVVIITGNDRVFAAGADIVEICSFTSSSQFLKASERGHDVLLKLEHLSKPVSQSFKGLLSEVDVKLL